MQAHDYRPEIDGLRALAVLTVVLFHAGLGFSGGYVGVDVFFVISGFLITSIIFKQIRQNSFTFAEFYERRIRRIAPALIVTVIATLFCAWFVVVPDDYERLGRAVVAQPLMVANIFHWRSSGYFGPKAETFPLLHTWSLAVEEQFYLFVPLLMVWLGRRRFLLLSPVLVVLFCASFALGVWGTENYPSAAFYLLPTRAWELTLGALLAIWSYRGVSVGSMLREMVSILALVIIMVSVVVFDSDTPFPGFLAIVPCIGAAAFLWANQEKITASGSVLSIKPLVFIGKISYSLYLVHWPIIVLYRYWDLGKTSWQQSVGLVLASLLVAAISWALVETPVRKKQILATRRSLFAVVGTMACLLLAGGYAIARADGFAALHSPAVLAILQARESKLFINEMTTEEVRRSGFPVFGDPDGDLACLVWGDSHAMSLIPAIHAACREAGVKGMQATHSATPPLLDFIFRGKSSLKEESVEFNQTVADFVVKSRVPIVFLAGAWHSYADDPSFEPCLRQTVRTLTEAGISVQIVRDVAQFDADVPLAIAKALYQGRDTDEVSMPLELHREKNRRCDEAFSRVAGELVTVIDPAPFFVDGDKKWRPVIDGKSMYRDSGHLSVEGALRLKPLFQQVLYGDAKAGEQSERGSRQTADMGNAVGVGGCTQDSESQKDSEP